MQNTHTPRKVTILGAGAWGTAVAIALAARHDVLLWARNPALIEASLGRAVNRALYRDRPMMQFESIA